jgi:hypothetical protein
MVSKIEELLGPRGAWPTWVLSNHDNSRHRMSDRGIGEARADLDHVRQRLQIVAHATQHLQDGLEGSAYVVRNLEDA